MRYENRGMMDAPGRKTRGALVSKAVRLSIKVDWYRQQNREADW